MNYLSEIHLHSNLTLGKSVEQWLGVRRDGEISIISWCRIDPENREQYSVTLFSVYDEGSADFHDVTAFTSVDPDVPFGNAHSFTTINEALAFALNRGAAISRFLNAGMVQEEYRRWKISQPDS